MHDSNGAANNVELVGKVFHVVVERAGDDGEDHVQEGEDGGEAKQSHVQVHLDVDVSSVRISKVELLRFGDPYYQTDDAQNVDQRVSHFGHVLGRPLQKQ